MATRNSMPVQNCANCARASLTQKDFAAKLGVSLPYLNQMENNNRPISSGVVLALASEFGMDVTELSSGDSERLVSDLREALADPVFAAETPPMADVRLVASNAPACAPSGSAPRYRQTRAPCVAGRSTGA